MWDSDRNLNGPHHLRRLAKFPPPASPSPDVGSLLASLHRCLYWPVLPSPWIPPPPIIGWTWMAALLLPGRLNPIPTLFCLFCFEISKATAFCCRALVEDVQHKRVSILQFGGDIKFPTCNNISWVYRVLALTISHRCRTSSSNRPDREEAMLC